MNLRPYQNDALKRLSRALHSRPILVIPTGGGKTHTATALVRQLNAPALWVAHRRELVFQAVRHINASEMPTKIVMGDESNDAALFSAPTSIDPAAPLIHVASIQTLMNRPVPAGVKLIIIDEAHHSRAESYGALFTLGVPVVGLTATPFRLDGKPLDMFGEIVVAAHVDELVRDGFLIAPRVFCCDAEAATNTDGERAIVGDIVAEWVKHADRVYPQQWHRFKTVCFAKNVAHSKDIVAAFNDLDIPAAHIDATTPKLARDEILRALHDGTVNIVSNYAVLTEGWDLPALECAILANPTDSLNYHFQTIGRVMRAAEDKQGAIVLDHAGNHHRHGMVTRRMEYSLNGTVKPAKDSEPLGMRRCKECGMYSPMSAVCCLGCGAVFASAPAEIVTAEGDLSEFDDTSFEYRDRFWRNVLVERDAQMHSDGWAAHRFNERFGVWPVHVGDELIDPTRATMEQKQAVFEGLVAKGIEKNFKPGWASWKYKEFFGVWPSGFVQAVRAAQLTNKWAGQEQKAG